MQWGIFILICGTLLFSLPCATANRDKRDVCSQPKDDGPCKAINHRYYYNDKTQKCEEFTYGGCMGNENNFLTKDDCIARCGRTKNKKDVCSEPADTGPCKAFFRHYYYDVKTQKCEKFIYGGCFGNKNNFLSVSDCIAHCRKTRNNDGICSQPVETGPCKALFPRYYYNVKTEKCEEFIYGGCMGNENNFLSKCECISRCGRTANKRDVCSEPADPGPCKAFFRRYYYDVKTQKCEKFIYGGCFGNKNIFLSESDCIARCGKTRNKRDVCSQPKDDGPCKAINHRYYYNDKTQKCEEFTYGGCMGNENNFLTKDDCIARCGRTKNKRDICSEPADPGPCKAFFPHYYYNVKTQKCEKFIYGGCLGNENNFLSESDCIARCGRTNNNDDICSQPMETGPCKALFPHYYYNVKTEKCEECIYGGCMGNENNFLSKCECISRYGRTVKSRDICSLPYDKGPCKGKFPRYYYSVKLRKCITFMYGGCKGNENNFKAEKECTLHCQKTKNIANKCQLPPETGICRAFLRRYFYNITTGRCEQFVFGGCHGNANNFNDVSSCQMECNPISLLPSFCTKLKDSGTCTADIPRFYFNQDTYSCERFSYSGCGGNDNNFVNLKVCQKICQPRVRKQSKKEFSAALKYN